ncbi:hypothetical protein BBJ28_00010135 [Nothophytophthora sp. Chile5]|nr:hypothetical protein BBJ28_00010135 [Nothophytophthora sp. Chile5]
MLLEKPDDVKHENSSGTGTCLIVCMGTRHPPALTLCTVVRVSLPPSAACAIYGVDAHPSRLLLATAGGDNTVKIWSLEPPEGGGVATFELLATLAFHQQAVNCVRWAGHGRYLASGSDDHLALLYELQEGAPAAVPFGSKASANKQNWVRCATLERHTMGERRADVEDVAWSPDDRMLATCSIDNSILVWDVGIGRLSEVMTRPLQTLLGHSGWVKGVAWDPVGKETDVVTEPFEACASTSHFRRLSWSPDGSVLCATHASNSKKNIAALLNRDTWMNDVKFVGHQSVVTSARFNPKLLGVFLPSASCRLFPDSHLFSTRRCFVVTEADPENEFACCAVGGKDATVSIWLAHLARPLAVVKGCFDASVTDLTWSSAQSLLLACSLDGSICCFQFGGDEIGTPISDSQQNKLLQGKVCRSFYRDLESFERCLREKLGVETSSTLHNRPPSGASKSNKKRITPVLLQSESLPAASHPASVHNNIRNILGPTIVSPTAADIAFPSRNGREIGVAPESRIENGTSLRAAEGASFKRKRESERSTAMTKSRGGVARLPSERADWVLAVSEPNKGRFLGHQGSSLEESGEWAPLVLVSVMFVGSRWVVACLLELLTSDGTWLEREAVLHTAVAVVHRHRPELVTEAPASSSAEMSAPAALLEWQPMACGAWARLHIFAELSQASEPQSRQTRFRLVAWILETGTVVVNDLLASGCRWEKRPGEDATFRRLTDADGQTYGFRFRSAAQAAECSCIVRLGLHRIHCPPNVPRFHSETSPSAPDPIVMGPATRRRTLYPKEQDVPSLEEAADRGQQPQEPGAAAESAGEGEDDDMEAEFYEAVRATLAATEVDSALSWEVERSEMTSGLEDDAASASAVCGYDVEPGHAELSARRPASPVALLEAHLDANARTTSSAISCPYKTREEVHVTYNVERARYEGLPAAWSMLNHQFGLPLETVPKRKVGGYEVRLPAVLEMMKDCLLAHGGARTEGVFRLAPDQREYAAVKVAINDGSFDSCADVHIMASLIKAWFRELPVSLFDTLPEKRMSFVCGLVDPEPDTVLQTLETLPALHQSVVLWLLDLLNEIVGHQQENKMTAKSLGTALQSVLALASYRANSLCLVALRSSDRDGS